MAFAALLLHEARYLLGSHPEQAIERDAHAYIPLAGGLVGLLLAIAAGQLVARVARARRDGSGEPSPRPFSAAWMAAAAGLLTTYAAQEALEAALAGGDPAVLFAHGGGWALPFALALGALVALACRGAAAAVRAAAQGGERRAPARPARKAPRPAVRTLRRRRPVLALRLAGRAPPLAS
jgi:hypothetical protein